MMRRLLPYPTTSVLLFFAWLLIAQSLASAHLLLALVLALLLPQLLNALEPRRDPHVYRPLAVAKLITLSSIEVVRSCFNVSRIILSRNPGQAKSQFMHIPLDMNDPYGMAVLAALMNLTPGTVWVEILPESKILALHVFDLHDEQWWIDTIKQRYEAPLMDIFERRGGEVITEERSVDREPRAGGES